MMNSHPISLTVAADGTASGATPPMNGKLHAVYLNFGNSIGAGTDTTITDGLTGAALLTISNSQTDAWYFPRQQVHTPAGVAMTYNGVAARIVAEPYAVNAVLTIAVAEGTEAGTLVATVFVEE